jgi:peptidoglycan/LPS O-acetylase OafA/YrhL
MPGAQQHGAGGPSLTAGRRHRRVPAPAVVATAVITAVLLLAAAPTPAAAVADRVVCYISNWSQARVNFCAS